MADRHEGLGERLSNIALIVVGLPRCAPRRGFIRLQELVALAGGQDLQLEFCEGDNAGQTELPIQGAQEDPADVLRRIAVQCGDVEGDQAGMESVVVSLLQQFGNAVVAAVAREKPRPEDVARNPVGRGRVGREVPDELREV